MLVGTYMHSIDPKYRLFIPAKFREEIGDIGQTLMLCRSLDKCINVYSKADWDVYFNRIMNSKDDANGRNLRRVLFSSAHSAEVDKQGRIILPPHLRKYANLIKDTVIIGTGKCLEIWSAEEWENIDQDKGLEEAMEALND